MHTRSVSERGAFFDSYYPDVLPAQESYCGNGQMLHDGLQPRMKERVCFKSKPRVVKNFDIHFDFISFAMIFTFYRYWQDKITLSDYLRIS